MSPLADIAENYLKGKSGLYWGKISNRSYEDKDGVKKYISEVVGREITLLGRPPEQQDNTQNNPSENKNNSDEDDLPF